MEKIFTDGINLIDEHGRQRIFRGYNLCFKSPNRHKKIKYDMLEKVARFHSDYCKKYGFNLIRLGFNWSEIEPEDGVFDEEVIESYVRMGKCFEENGIYFYLDVHQDVWGKSFNNGAPKWATYTDGIKPKRHLVLWPEGYFYMNAVTNAFTHFWKNDFNLIDKFTKMWAHVIKAFDGNTALIGYDYLNEPYPVPNGRKIFLEILENIFSLMDGKHIDYSDCFNTKFERLGFLRMGIKLFFRIRTVGRLKRLLKAMDNRDNWTAAVCSATEYLTDFEKNLYSGFIKNMDESFGDRFSLFEHTYYNNLGIPFEFDKPSDNCVYSPHGYDLWVDTPMYKNASMNRVGAIFGQVRETQLRLNCPVIVGEWGAGAKGDKWFGHIEDLLDVFEEYQWSFTYWGPQLKNEKFMKIFARPYPIAVSGKIVGFNNRDGSFHLEFDKNSDCTAKTLIFDGTKVIEFEATDGRNVIEF